MENTVGWRAWFLVPNLLTELRIVMALCMGIAIWQYRPGWTLAFAAIAAASDLFDGPAARWIQQESRLGSYLDPAADKLFFFVAFGALALVGRIPMWVPAVVVVRDLTVTSAAWLIYAKTKFGDFNPIWSGKARTTSELLTLLFVVLYWIRPLWPFLAFTFVGYGGVVFFTALSGAQYTLTMMERYHAYRLSLAAS